MVKKLDLKPGRYWFYGCPSGKYSLIQREFEDFLDYLPIGNTNYMFDCGDQPDENLIGIFYFDIDPSSGLSRPTLDYYSVMINGLEGFRKKFLDNPDCIQLSYKSEVKDSFICNPEDIREKVLQYNVKLIPGKTRCSESCMFYWACNGDQDSSLPNPSECLIKGVSCRTHNFEK